MKIVASDSDSLSVDVVIPTFRRPEDLDRCLKALECQSVAPASVEVVDDSEEDRGPAFSRNIGWKRGNAPIVAFTDDDCVPSTDWIESILDEFSVGGVDVIEGSVTTESEGVLLSMDPHPGDRWNRFKTANMAYRRRVLEEIGGFDERYFIHREDTDIAWRAIISGFSISWSPKCVVHHPNRQGMQRIIPRSEILLYRCDSRKYVEVAAGMISFEALKSGKLKEIRKSFRTYSDDFVNPLSRMESFFLWTRSFSLAFLRKIGFR
tara:strand:+ start:7539 stop:8330 length:792 start_codon:yes stop_codon:yes gene_type:complete